ncbi:MAG: family 10 glycosylhydrolase [Opitutaceae bacterium]
MNPINPTNIRGPIFNQDSTDFFYARTPEQMSVAEIHGYIDRLANAGIGTFVSCGNAMKANFVSEVWECEWSGYDSAGPDDQPVLRHLPKSALPGTRNRLDAVKRLADQGIDFHREALTRCRQRGVGAWMTIRMNDVHGCMDEDSPLLSQFFMQQRAARKLRAMHRDRFWMDRALDWELPEVQEHYFKFVREVLQRYDLDGIELDWMRFVVHFRPGRELEGGKVITAWMQRVKAECAKAAERLGHPVKLGVRVPTRPETARRLGLDGVAWAKAGLIDLLVATPFWATADFDVPVAEWRRLLEGTSVHFAVSVEVRYQPAPEGPAKMISTELLGGLGTTILHGGADSVYLFNIFPAGHGLDKLWGPGNFDAIIGALRSLDSVAARERIHAITYHDVRAPGEPPGNALPATDQKWDQPSPGGFALRVQTGPKPESGRACVLTVEWAEPVPAVEVVRTHLNGRQLKLIASDNREWRYAVPGGLMENEAQVVEIETPGKDTVVRLELQIAAKT